MGDSEKQPLLKKNCKEIKNDPQSLSKFNNIILNIIIAVFAAASILESKVSPLYMYQYLSSTLEAVSTGNSNNTNTTGFNNSADTNETDDCGKVIRKASKPADSHLVQSEEALWLWYFSILTDSILFFIVVGMGCCSDYLGRKPFLILTLLGHSVIYFTKAYIIYRNLGMSFFLITAAIGGVTSSSLFHIACMAIVADTTKPDKSRSVGVALVDMASGLGYTTTQLASGYLVENTGYVFPCLLSGGICFIAAILGCMFIPETVKRNKDTQYNLKESFKNLIGFYHNKKYLQQNGSRLHFNFVVLILIVYRFQSSSISTVYVLGSPFCWSAEAIAWHSFASESMHLLLNVPILKLLHFCIHDAAAGFLGCLSAVVDKIIYGLADQSWMLYLATGTGILSAIPLTVLKAMMSRMVTQEYQGALFANIYIIVTLCAMGSTSVFNNIYSATQDFMPGFTYLTTAGVTLITGFLFIPLIFVNRKMEEDRASEITIEHRIENSVVFIYKPNRIMDVDGQANMYLTEQTGF